MTPVSVQPAIDRRRELGRYLRARREHTSPADIGLPGSPRRRTPGLRREELAASAGISTTWYTFLEQGRDVRPSTQVLGAIADALRLEDAERAHLFTLVTDVVVPREDQEFLAPEVAGVPVLLEPTPAYVTGSSFDLLAWNPAAAAMFPGATEGDRPNLARWVLLDPAARAVLVDWETVAQSLLGRVRANAGRHPGSPRFQRLEQELRAGSPEADGWWSRYDIATSRGGTKAIRDRDGRERLVTYASFAVSGDPEQLLTVYTS